MKTRFDITTLCCAQSPQSIRLSVTPWTVAHQAPLSTELIREEYWSGWPCSAQGIFPTQGSTPHLPASPALQVDSILLSHWGTLLLHYPKVKWAKRDPSH